MASLLSRPCFSLCCRLRFQFSRPFIHVLWSFFFAALLLFSLHSTLAFHSLSIPLPIVRRALSRTHDPSSFHPALLRQLSDIGDASLHVRSVASSLHADALESFVTEDVEQSADMRGVVRERDGDSQVIESSVDASMLRIPERNVGGAYEQSSDLLLGGGSAGLLSPMHDELVKAHAKLIPVSKLKPQPSINATLQGRREWLKVNWSSFKILYPDDPAKQFPRRMREFFTGNSQLHGRENLTLLSSQPCTIRFYMTWIVPLSSFGPRERLALESVFKTHPSACLIILSRTLDSRQGQQLLQPFTERGFRLMAVSPDVPFLFKSTPAEEWFRDLKEGKIDPGSISFNQNLSNILRLVVLYKYGGIYIDSDTIVLRNFSGFSNAIGAQNVNQETGKWNRLNNAVMVFDKKHPLLLKFIQEFSLTFNGSKWGHNGPYLVSRVVNRVKERGNLRCRILPPLAFYPVNWEHISGFFRAPRDTVEQKWLVAKMQQLKHSYSIHLWNKESREMEIEPGSIMDLVFRKCCVFCDLHIHRAALRAQAE